MLGRLALICLVLGGLAARPGAAQSEPPREPIVEYRFGEMGIEFRLLVAGPDPQAIEPACERCRLRVAELNQIFSDYSATSEVARLRTAASHEPVTISPELYQLLDVSLALSRRSAGAFDVTVGPLTQMWRVARRAGSLPPREAWNAARQQVGWQHLRLVPPSQLQFDQPGMQLDFGGIAQGYAADECLRILCAAGFPAAIVDASGDIAIGAAPPGRPRGWRVAISRPRGKESAEPAATGPEEFTEYLELSQCGISTSGDSHQYLEVDGVRLSHILDPRNGEPVRDGPQVTVIAETATWADAYASALSVLAPEAGAELLAEQPGLSALWQWPPATAGTAPQREPRRSPGFPQPLADSTR